MGDHYLLNGTKNWITNGGTSSVHLVIAQTYPEKKHRGINAFIVETSWPGVTIGRQGGQTRHPRLRHPHHHVQRREGAQGKPHR
jgi:alkylation response protein AidB-like acyl-CoA dehydrogenase